MKKITLFLILLMMSSVAFTAAAGNNMRGDVDGDGRVNIDDVTGLINYLLTGNSSLIVMENADVYPDGKISIDDVTSLINYLLGGALPEPAHDYVDLGLPSGTLWATCNIGANSPEDYGDYFAWGETEPKEQYDWTTYKWCMGSNTTMTKYCTDSGYGYDGFVDNKWSLDLEDDAAYVNWGPLWRMPSQAHMNELRVSCTWEWTTQNGVNGYLVTGPNGASLFLPAAGWRDSSSLKGTGKYGQYWSSTLNVGGPNCHAFLLGYDSSSWYNVYISYRDRGCTVRPIRASQN